jgi:hypothetical protein
VNSLKLAERKGTARRVENLYVDTFPQGFTIDSLNGKLVY